MPTILVIDDNRTIQENTVEFLEMEGFYAITANNGKDGFDKICKYKPDLIVCDLLMPEMGGLELLTKLGSHTELKHIPVIIFSAKSEKMDISKGMDFGAYDYIVKPSDLEDLLASIKKCFQQNQIS
ncbi:hypothetical protein GCM10011414_11100 [Croceivirga lutea]|uniref:response regulator transcription factor n=1 Tax=Croceivirga lutea TaxID=1775167 RepID=UPI00163A1D63|nr:response regulator [Croceivirga lutea]GGG43230.1 hypothetical protein GCM10011414_11100 [Croceivirga lutea]